MSHLILVRHGNTFEQDQTPTFVGGKTDMKLTAKGEEQGDAIAAMIAKGYAPIDGIICGPLQRTHRFAELIAKRVDQPFTIDQRLCEIDYGLWENKTSASVRAAYGDALVDAWEIGGVWPQGMNWAPSEQKLRENVGALLSEHHNLLRTPAAHNRVIVTSNGILRFVYSNVTDRPADKAAKVGTGAYCILAPTQSGWTMQAWNKKPD